MIRKPVLLLVGVAAAVLVVALSADHQDGSEAGRKAARRASVEALGFLDRDPALAARLALAGERLDPTSSGEMAMLAVAAHSAGIERVIDPGDAPVSAAIREESAVVTATGDRMLRIWRPSSGALLGQVRTAAPLSALADGFSGQSLAGATAQGGIALIDISNPHMPRLREIGSVLPAGERLLALSYDASGADLLVLGASGTIVRVDGNTGRVISRWSLREIGLVNSEPASDAVAAASFEVDFLGGEQLLLGTTTGAVVRVNMRTRQAHRLLAPGSAPGRITSVAREPYGYPQLVVGATGGAVTVFEPAVEPSISRGQSITAVATDGAGDTWLGSGEGIEVVREEGIPTETPVGESVSRLSKGSGGILAITRRGKVELLGGADAGLALEAPSTSALAFEPNGYLLAAEGLDAGHVERLVALDPGHQSEDGETVFNPEVRGYRLDSHWWPYAEEGSGLSLSDVAADSSFVAAAGQDPTGAVAVLVWDRKSGRPLRRLTLGAGSIEPGWHDVVSALTFLPGRHMVVAYSAVQQLVAAWSTDTWRRVASIPVGTAGGLSLSADESTLAVATVSESAEEGGIGNTPSKLVFIDTGSWRVESEVRTPDTYRVAWSPDGNRIATIGRDGMLRFWSPGTSEETQPPLQLEGTPLTLAWRPDGRALAVSLEGAGVVIVDPNRRETFFNLPGSSASSPLAWSPDGSLLAAATSRPPEEEGGYGIPEPAQIWTLGAARLARRMCQLAGGPISTADWRRLVDPTLHPRPLCPLRKSEAPPQSSDKQHDAPVLAYQSGHGVFVSDENGLVTQVGSVEEESYPPISFAWSKQGLAWLGSDQADILPDGSQRPSWWPCHCAGIAWIEGSAFALSSDGGELLRFAPGKRRPGRVPVEDSLGQEPRVLGSLGDTLAVAGFLGMPARGTPNALFLVARDGSVSRVAGSIEGVLVPPTAIAPAGDEVAFVSSRSGGACYFSTKVGILSLGPGGEPKLRFPPMPGHAWLKVVTSLQIDSAGTVSGTFGRFGCVGNESPSAPPSGERFELHGMTWAPTGEQGGDVQRTGKVIAVVSPEPSFEAGGELTLQTSSGRVAIADAVTQLSVRP